MRGKRPRSSLQTVTEHSHNAVRSGQRPAGRMHTASVQGNLGDISPYSLPLSLSLSLFLPLSHPFSLPIFHLFFLPSFLPFYLSSFPFKILLILSLFLIIPLFFSSFFPFSHPTPPINFLFFPNLNSGEADIC